MKVRHTPQVLSQGSGFSIPGKYEHFLNVGGIFCERAVAWDNRQTARIVLAVPGGFAAEYTKFAGVAPALLTAAAGVCIIS